MSAKTLRELMASVAIEPSDVVFRAPWEARVFAIALTLCQSGKYEWDEFRRLLTSEVSAGAGSEPQSDDYYRQFLRALEKMLARKRILEHAELTRRLRELSLSSAAAPPVQTR